MQQTITRSIRQRTNGGVQFLEVEVKGDTVIVRGRCPSYYMKQLAVQGVLDVLAAKGSMQVAYTIEVAYSPPGCEADAKSEASLLCPRPFDYFSRKE